MQSVECHMCLGETVDVFLADLEKVSMSFGELIEQDLKAAFVYGLPEHVQFCLHLLEWKRWTFSTFSSSESHKERWLI